MSAAHFRKFSPVDREHPIFEYVDAQGTVLFDVTFHDSGEDLEVTFHTPAIGRSWDFDVLKQLLEEGRALAIASGK